MKISRQKLISELVLLTNAWAVYILTQNDVTLPLLAFLIVAPFAIFLLFKKQPSQFSLDLSWRIVIAVAVGLGLMWRTILPEPVGAVSFIPVLLPALQSASVIVSVLIWYRFKYQWRSVALRLISWMIVALSMNVKLNALSQFAFWSFCFINIGSVLRQTYHRPAQENIQRKDSKNISAAVYPVFLGLVALSVFMVLLQGAKLGDDVFMSFIRDYMGRRHLKLFDSKLKLDGPGGNMFMVKPVLEIDKARQPLVYLPGQVFEHYANGVWDSVENTTASQLPQNNNRQGQEVEILMYEYLEDIIPAPRGVVGFTSKTGSFKKDDNGIIFNERKTIPEAVLFISDKIEISELNENDFQNTTRLNSELAQHLESRISAWGKETTDPLRFAVALERYFKQNFRYTLNPNFMADDRGLLNMLDQKRPAYCSYFASAMTLMLRAHGIPARMVTGFQATEQSGWDKHKFMVRGRDAHAWVEAFIPDKLNPASEKIRTGRWLRFDPTPPDYGSNTKMVSINRFADFLWCGQKRLKAALLNVDTKTLVKILVGVIVFIALQELIKKGSKNFWLRRSKGYSIPDADYKQNINWPFYLEFERYLKKEWGITRPESETDAELIRALKKRQDIPSKLINQMEDFLTQYQENRFGLKSDFLFEKELQLVVQFK